MSEVILTQNKIHGRIPEWPKGTDCKSAANCFDGSNPSPSICRSGGTGRRPGLKIPWVVIPVPVRSRFAARLRALIHTNRSSFSISIFQPPVPTSSPLFQHLPTLTQHSHADPPPADPAAFPSAPTTSLAASRSVLRDAQGSIGKAVWKSQKKWRPFERLKSGAQHQISRHSELGNHQDFLANNAGVYRKTSIFSTFFPAFPPLPCASRKTGRAAARRPSLLTSMQYHSR